MPTPSARRERLAPVIVTNGIFMLIIGGSEILLALWAAFFDRPSALPFLLAGAVTIMVGGIALYGNYDEDLNTMSRRQVLFSMISAWVSASIVAALPFMIGAPYFNFEFALFEAVSAITTTGATVMVGIEDQPQTILLWRSLLHWYGGMGIIIGAMVFFPAMRIGGMQFFLRAGFEESDKLLPSARALGRATLGAYSFMTILCMLAYIAAGIPSFDAVNLAMSTVATGGLAVSDMSFGLYPGLPEYVAALFMILAGFPLIVFIAVLRGNPKALIRDPQIPFYLLVYLTMVLAITLYRLSTQQGDFEDLLRNSVFISASMLTGTGFTNGDFELWGAFPVMVLFLGMFIGGCTGSTSGSIKIFRYQVLIELVRVRIKRLYYPHGMFVPKYDGRTLDERVLESVAGFFMIYLTSLAILTMLFGFTGLDLITGFSAAVSAVGNIGPGLGPEIGPVGNYAGFGSLPLWIYMIAMIIGRLEFMFFYALLLPRFWRH